LRDGGVTPNKGPRRRERWCCPRWCWYWPRWLGWCYRRCCFPSAAATAALAAAATALQNNRGRWTFNTHAFPSVRPVDSLSAKAGARLISGLRWHKTNATGFSRLGQDLARISQDLRTRSQAAEKLGLETRRGRLQLDNTHSLVHGKLPVSR